LVICAVFLTDLIRRLISLVDGIHQFSFHTS
jgi:hypothetical protein